MAFRVFEKNYSQRVVVYLHPWEIDPEQPRMAGKLKSKFRHYTQLKNMSRKVGRLLQRYRFERFCDVVAADDANDLNGHGAARPNTTLPNMLGETGQARVTASHEVNV
jgi:hypothetical protein